MIPAVRRLPRRAQEPAREARGGDDASRRPAPVSPDRTSDMTPLRMSCDSLRMRRLKRPAVDVSAQHLAVPSVCLAFSVPGIARRYRPRRGDSRLMTFVRSTQFGDDRLLADAHGTRLQQPWPCASVLGGASDDWPARMQSCRQRRAATSGVIQMSPLRSSARNASDRESARQRRCELRLEHAADDGLKDPVQSRSI
jgi:hypothetical protein